MIAIDIDIRRITLVAESGPAVQVNGPEAALLHLLPYPRDTVLIEVASPVFYHGDSKAAASSTARWMIWNSLVAGIIYRARVHGLTLCSPSSRWAMGYKEKERHSLAGMEPLKKNKKGVDIYAENHDVRECRAMLWSYTVKPALWTTFPGYLEGM